MLSRNGTQKKNKCYGIIVGGKDYIVDTWAECEALRDEDPYNAKYRGFRTRRDAALWITLTLQAMEQAQSGHVVERPTEKASKKTYYYAVHVGRETGVYDSWEECKRQIDGFSDADYCMFLDKDMAQRWPDAVLAQDSSEPDNSERFAMCYVSGSYNQATGKWGYGVVLFEEDHEDDAIIFANSGKSNADYESVAGECYGAITGVKQAKKLGYTTVFVCASYEGVEAWATYRWDRQDAFARMYSSTMYALKQSIEVEFQKASGSAGKSCMRKARDAAEQIINNK